MRKLSEFQQQAKAGQSSGEQSAAVSATDYSKKRQAPEAEKGKYLNGFRLFIDFVLS